MNTNSLISAMQIINRSVSTEEIAETPFVIRSPFIAVTNHSGDKVMHDLFTFNHEGNQIVLHLDYSIDHMSIFVNGTEISITAYDLGRFDYNTSNHGYVTFRELESLFSARVFASS
jgi:hypothetical protein